MSLMLLSVGFLATLVSNPFDHIRDLPALKNFTEVCEVYPLIPRGATLLATKGLSDGSRRLTVEAFRFSSETEVSREIKACRDSRQGATIGIPLPEFEKKGFQISYVGLPKCNECDVVVKKVWILVQLVRSSRPNETVLMSGAQLAHEFRSDRDSFGLLKVLLPWVKEQAKLANDLGHA